MTEKTTERSYTLDVEVSTHAALRRGVTAVETRRVTVLATGLVDACLLASQLAATRGMPTRVLLVDD